VAETEQLKVQIVLDDGSIKTGFIGIEKQAQKSSKNIESSFDKSNSAMLSGIKSLGVAFAAAFSVAKIAGFLKDSARSAMEAESATNAFGASLVQIGKYSKDAISDFREYASQLQATTGIEDDLIVKNAALLTSIGNLSGEGLKSATKASLDLATALQIDVGSAFDLVAKAAGGNTAALSRYGLRIDENIPKSQKFASALSMIQNRFGGLAETKLNTFEGALANLGNAFDNLKESIGFFIVESPAIRAVFNVIAEAFSSLAKSVDNLRAGSGDVFKPFLIGVLEFAQAVNEYLIKPLELGFNLLRTGVYSIYTAIQGLIAGFVGISSAIAKYIFQPIINGFGFISEKLVGLFNKDLAAKISNNIKEFGEMVGSSLTPLAESTSEVFQDAFNSLSESAQSNFVSKFGYSIDQFLIKLKTAVAESKNSTKAIENNVATTAAAVGVSITSLADTIKSGMTDAIASIGAALYNGTGLFDDFGKGIVGIMGDMAIQIGKTLLFTGLAIESFITSINSLLPGSGLVAAAAGVGLIIFGGALKASVGKGSSSGPSSSGGGIAASPSSTTDLTQTQDLERPEAGTKISLTVQGDILDSDESGSRIVNLINQAFDKKGVVLNQAVMA
jgi:hypothetical protein